MCFVGIPIDGITWPSGEGERQFWYNTCTITSNITYSDDTTTFYTTFSPFNSLFWLTGYISHLQFPNSDVIFSSITKNEKARYNIFLSGKTWNFLLQPFQLQIFSFLGKFIREAIFPYWVATTTSKNQSEATACNWIFILFQLNITIIYLRSFFFPFFPTQYLHILILCTQKIRFGGKLVFTQGFNFHPIFLFRYPLFFAPHAAI